jgi:hypothetical protein
MGIPDLEVGEPRPDIVDEVGKLIALSGQGRITNHNIKPERPSHIPLAAYLTWNANGELVVD